MFERFLPTWTRRAAPPPPPPPLGDGVPNHGVRIVDGLIRPQYACQTDIVDHCNLSCRDCNHLAPVARKRHADPDTLYRDFALLAKVYRPLLVQLMGGEPLLHPNIVAVMGAVRASGITDRIQVVTNGHLLARMPDAFWEAVNDVEISQYPGEALDAATLARHQDQARAFGVRLEIYEYPAFRRMFSRTANPDPALTRRIYRACKQVWVWGCHAIYDGYLYRCPQSAYLRRALDSKALARAANGLKLRDDAGFQADLLALLTDPEPLPACVHCLGTAGVMRPNIQVPRRDWLADQDGPIPALVDATELARIEAELHLIKPDHIKTRRLRQVP